MLTGYTTQPPSHDQQSSYQKNVHECFFLDLHTCTCVFWVWSGCKAGNCTEQVLATTSCQIVEVLLHKNEWFSNFGASPKKNSCKCKRSAPPLFSLLSLQVLNTYISWNCYHFDDSRGGRNHLKSVKQQCLV